MFCPLICVQKKSLLLIFAYNEITFWFTFYIFNFDMKFGENSELRQIIKLCVNCSLQK